jgi:NADPH2:quinone reductase
LGVGHLRIQLAKWAGAKVYATVSSPEKGAIARQLGADEVINYREQSVEEYVAQYTKGKGFDVVFDTIGKRLQPLISKQSLGKPSVKWY